MAHAYCAVLPISPLPGAPLPLSPFRPGPTHFGPTPEAASPWLHLALYCASGRGPRSLALAAGQRLWRPPPQLARCTHALVWSWDPEPRPGLDSCPLLVEGAALLPALNDMLARAAVLVQPLLYSRPAAAGGGQEGGGAAATGQQQEQEQEEEPQDVEFADIALPLDPDAAAAAAAADGVSSSGGGGTIPVRAVHRRTGAHVDVALPRTVARALAALGLDRAVGFLRVIRVSGGGGDCSAAASDGGDGDGAPAAAAAGEEAGGDSGSGSGDGGWLPLAVQLGVPLYNLQLCRDVCAAAVRARFLSPEARAAHAEASRLLQARLWRLIAAHGAAAPPGAGAAAGAGGWAPLSGGDGNGNGGNGGGGGGVPAGLAELRPYAELPADNLLFDGARLRPLDLSGCQQAAAGFCAA